MHSARALRYAGNFGTGADFGALRARLRRDSDVEPRGGDVRRYARARLHEDGNRGALRADCTGDPSTGSAAAAEAGRNRQADDSPHEVFWREDCGDLADAAGAAEGQLAAKALLRPPMTFFASLSLQRLWFPTRG